MVKQTLEKKAKSVSKKLNPKESWPKIIQGSHSTFIEHENGNLNIS